MPDIKPIRQADRLKRKPYSAPAPLKGTADPKNRATKTKPK